MHDKSVALVNWGQQRHRTSNREAPHRVTVLVGSRKLESGAAAAKSICTIAHARSKNFRHSRMEGTHHARVYNGCDRFCRFRRRP